MMKGTEILGKNSLDRGYKIEQEELLKELSMRIKLREEKKDQKDNQSLEDFKSNNLLESDIKTVVF